jgi:hypothetical protein
LVALRFYDTGGPEVTESWTTLQRVECCELHEGTAVRGTMRPDMPYTHSLSFAEIPLTTHFKRSSLKKCARQTNSCVYFRFLKEEKSLRAVYAKLEMRGSPGDEEDVLGFDACTFLGRYERFEETYCLHLQD